MRGRAFVSGAISQQAVKPPRQSPASSSLGQTESESKPVNSNGYDHLQGEWLTYYKVASRFTHKAKAEDTEDLLHDIILTLAGSRAE